VPARAASTGQSSGERRQLLAAFAGATLTQGTHMTSIANATAASAAAALTTLTHGHGHKGRPGSIEDASAVTSPTASGTTQNLFSTLLQSIEQAIGVSLAGSAGAAGSTAVTGARAPSTVGSSTLGGAALSATTLGSKVNATA
jgi:hypothetical protein